MALVKLHLDYPLHFLENLKYKFTDWGQINVYDTFIFHNIEVPQFAVVRCPPVAPDRAAQK